MERKDVTEAIRLLCLIHDADVYVEQGDEQTIVDAIAALIDIEDELSEPLE